MKESLKPIVQTEEQFLFVCHMVGPFLQRFHLERTRCMLEVRSCSDSTEIGRVFLPSFGKSTAAECFIFGKCAICYTDCECLTLLCALVCCGFRSDICVCLCVTVVLGHRWTVRDVGKGRPIGGNPAFHGFDLGFLVSLSRDSNCQAASLCYTFCFSNIFFFYINFYIFYFFYIYFEYFLFIYFLYILLFLYIFYIYLFIYIFYIFWRCFDLCIIYQISVLTVMEPGLKHKLGHQYRPG